MTAHPTNADRNAAKLAAIKKAIREARTKVKIALERDNWAAVRLNGFQIMRLASEAQDLIG